MSSIGTHASPAFKNFDDRITALEQGGGAGGPHTHSVDQVTGLQAALDGKQVSGDYASSVHGHAIADVTGLQAALDGKAASDHTHASSGDAWTYVRLANDFTTSSATAVDVGLGFTPAANQRYEFEAQLKLRTASATVNPRAGLAWATGLTDGVGNIEEAQSATTSLQAKGNIGAALLIAVGGLPNTTQSWPATAWGHCEAGATPSGSVRIQLASETAGTNVVCKAGSFLKYRTIP